jgi:hypothetical protein
MKLNGFLDYLKYLVLKIIKFVVKIHASNIIICCNVQTKANL